MESGLISEMEPLLTPDGDQGLSDAVFDLLTQSSSLAGQIPKAVQGEIGRLVQSMNCYYSNLIEGHNTHPRDIERALHSNFQTDPKKRDLQIEARAHIEVQRLIDSGADESSWPASQSYARWIHREFCSRLPSEMLWVEDKAAGKRVPVVPGEFRTENVAVGQHIPPRKERIPACMERFDAAYAHTKLSKVQQVISRWTWRSFTGRAEGLLLIFHFNLHRSGRVYAFTVRTK
jgi:Fic family protein